MGVVRREVVVEVVPGVVRREAVARSRRANAHAEERHGRDGRQQSAEHELPALPSELARRARTRVEKVGDGGGNLTEPASVVHRARTRAFVAARGVAARAFKRSPTNTTGFRLDRARRRYEQRGSSNLVRPDFISDRPHWQPVPKPP